QKLAGLLNLRKTTLPGGFFVYRARDYARKKRISRRSFYKLDIQPHKEEYLNHLGICIGRITSDISPHCPLPARHHTLTITPRT
ncbi:hypothetical protein RVO12_24285, partial [Enterobacter hormaechei]|nr:hypothetical protein [Enterobacter hormaechei]